MGRSVRLSPKSKVSLSDITPGEVEQFSVDRRTAPRRVDASNAWVNIVMPSPETSGSPDTMTFAGKADDDAKMLLNRVRCTGHLWFDCIHFYGYVSTARSLFVLHSS